MSQQKAIELFIADEKHKRTLSIIQELLDGSTKADIANKYGIDRRQVFNIEQKYIKPTK